MTFLNPAGLWLLLGIPVLILIYLIKSQHDERPISSTYIWKLSTRFSKKRVPLQRMRKVLAFILQLLIILILALTAARPAVNTGKVCDYVAIIDASAGMHMRDTNGTSRFERAVKDIEKLAAVTEDGHTVSVILAADRASFLVQKATTAKEVKEALKAAVCSIGDCNVDGGLALAQQVCDQSPNAAVTFYTDRDYPNTQNVQVVNLAQNEWNISVDTLSAAADEDGDTVFTGLMTGHGADATVAVGLRIDGKLIDAQVVACKAGTQTEIVFKVQDLSGFDTAEMFIEEADGLAQDNAFAVCRQPERAYRVSLISAAPLYLQQAFLALDNCEVSVYSSAEESALQGYDLYVFDGIVPQAYPADGSVLLFATENLPAGITIGQLQEKVGELSAAKKTPHAICNNLTFRDTVVATYAPLSATADWESVLLCDEQTVWMTKPLHNGLHFSVCSFDLHDSNLPMQTDFVMLLQNLLDYAVPMLLERTDYTIGETMNITVLRGTEKLYIEMPDGTMKPLSVTEDAHAVKADAVGIHTVLMQNADNSDYIDCFVHLDADETASDPIKSTLHITLYETNEKDMPNTVSDIRLWIVIAVLVIILAEWGWYYREQC